MYSIDYLAWYMNINEGHYVHSQSIQSKEINKFEIMHHGNL